ncbi:MAG: hypothetical protein U0X20_22940 [Caldilineaceae bacterium]
MAIFAVGVPVKTEEPVVEVEAPRGSPLLPGVYFFELKVVDDAGNESAPVQARVVISDPGPVAVIRAEEKVPFGEKFKLDGSGSSDIPPGRVVTYIWTMSQRGLLGPI